MTPAQTGDSSETIRLLGRAAGGDGSSWGTLLTRHEGRLRRMVAFRLDPRLRGRVDAADVLQEIHLEASRHMARLPPGARHAAVPLAEGHRGPQAPGGAPLPPGHADARRPSRDRALPGRSARCDLGGHRGATAGARDATERGRDAGRGADPAAGGAQLRWIRWSARSWRCGTSSS